MSLSQAYYTACAKPISPKCDAFLPYFPLESSCQVLLSRFSSCDVCLSEIWQQFVSSPGALPFGSHCSFEQDSCGWSVSNQPLAWRRVAGDALLEKEDMQGVTLQSTPGWLRVCVYVCVWNIPFSDFITSPLVNLFPLWWIIVLWRLSIYPDFSPHVSHCLVWKLNFLMSNVACFIYYL